MSKKLELNYFNTFWVKKMTSVVAANPQPTAPYDSIPGGNTSITPPVPSYSGSSTDWYIEESRIRGGYNNTSVDFGVKAYIVEPHPEQQNRINTLIYSGIFNSRTGINNTNQFSVAEDITRSVDPANGSIQKLYAEDTNLIIFQEDKISRALIDKDAIYSAEGAALTTSGRLVIGQIVAFKGEYGISQDPESFAVYGYRKYFTDRKRNAVLRLSSAGEIVEISGYGMHDFFRDKLSATDSEGNDIVDKIVGGFDLHNKNYVLSIQNTTASGGEYNTTSFDEDVQGWTSFFTYKPDFINSLKTSLYTFKKGLLWKHHSGNYGSFYVGAGAEFSVQPSNVTVVLNSDPSVVKNFKTINYEGSPGWSLQSMIASSSDATLPINAYVPATSMAQLEQQLFSLNFKKKENKFFANLQQQYAPSLTPEQGEVIWGSDMSGIKGFWSTVIITVDNINDNNVKKELFAVSSNTVESSY